MLKKKEEQLKVVPYMECGIQYTDIKNFYERGHGIDFYIDQARYLPDGCTVTRLIIRGITNTNDKMIGSTKTYSEINDSTRQIQVYDFRMEIRPENQVKKSKTLHPTTYMEIMIETVDRSDMTEKIVGYAYFPLFLMADQSLTPPFEESTQQFVYNQGDFQIPIYYKRVPSGGKFAFSHIQKLPKIHCATLLVRAYPCPVDTRGKNVSLEHNSKLAEHQLVERGILKEPTGHYSSGVYNSKDCLTTPEEVSLYKFKHKRYNPVMNMTLAYLF